MTMIRATTHKVCSRCHEDKTAEFFYLTGQGYLNAWCKACTKIGAAAWAKANQKLGIIGSVDERVGRYLAGNFGGGVPGGQ